MIDDPFPVLSWRPGASDPDLDAPDRVGTQRGDHGAHAVVASRAALHAHAHLAQRQVEVVEHDDEIARLEMELLAQASDHRSGDVHEAAGLDEEERHALPLGGRDLMTAVA